jgi:bidirectional [NiFe] hydrogenase diaphorase subunit
VNEAELLTAAQQERERLQQRRCRFLVCASSGCLASNSGALEESLRRIVAADESAADVDVVPTGCVGLCSHGPLVRVQTRGLADLVYPGVSPDLAESMVAAHLKAQPAMEIAQLSPELPFFAKQLQVVLANSGRIDPERLEDYLAVGGYAALAKAVTDMTPLQVIEEVSKSGLRGRGGAGFSAGVKWGLVARAQSDEKYVICNGDEGDPGAYMDRTVMEADPHRVLEGMAIAAYAVGANQGFIYVRGEYPIAVKRLEKAIRMAERQGILGTRVLDTAFQFRVDIRIGAGAFVCGEETALINSIEGGRGVPRPRPPYPAQSGLWGNPTLINNVETLASIAPIIANGGDWYASLGTEKSKGTKVFALAGKVNRTGPVEVPLGMTLRELIYDIGGGIPADRPFKAAQTGGPSGGCIPAEFLDLPLDYESLARVGSIVGSGGLIVMDDTSCMVDVARFYMDFCAHESCGKCIPCRAGTVQAVRLLERIADGRGTLDDLARLELLCPYMQEASLCGLGQTAPNPVVSTLRYFRDEYLAHIQDRVCPAGVCAMRGAPAVRQEVPA